MLIKVYITRRWPIIFAILFALVCCSIAMQANAANEGTTFDGITIDPSNTPTADQPTYPINIKDSSGNVIFRVDTSGNITYLAGMTGFPQAVKSLTLTKANWVAGTGFTVTAAQLREYNTFYLNLDQIPSETGEDGTSGVTVNVPTPTAEIDSKPITFVNTSGTTKFFIHAASKINTSTGVTDYFTKSDAEGDSVTIVPHYTGTPGYTVINYINR
jgi:hypothetical protein